jgi:hypothetical protein
VAAGRAGDAAIFFVPPRWEVVQLVGLQTLTLAILVRVQASQPILLTVGNAVLILQ